MVIDQAGHHTFSLPYTHTINYSNYRSLQFLDKPIAMLAEASHGFVSNNRAFLLKVEINTALLILKQ